MATPLLGKSDPPPAELVNKSGVSRCLFVSEHAGNRVPSQLGTLGLSSADLDDHMGWDLHIRAVGEALSVKLDATYICQTYSRLVIDCNRPPGSEGSILSVSDRCPVPGNQGLADTQRKAREDEIFRPFHDMIAATIDTRLARGQETILVTLHSFTPAMESCDAPRPWDITLQYGRQPDFSRWMMEKLRSDASIIVGDNVPYPVDDESDYSIPIHGESRNLLHTMVEIRQDGISTPAGRSFWVDKLATVLSDIT